VSVKARKNETTMLKCRDIARQASDYLDHNQSFRQRLDVMLHLLICGNCRAFLKHLRTSVAYYQKIPRPELSDEDAAAITSRVIKASKPPE
jgi:hypothetical protein